MKSGIESWKEQWKSKKFAGNRVKKYLYTSLLLILVAVSAVFYFVNGRNKPIVIEDTNQPATTTVSARPEGVDSPKPKPEIVFGVTTCQIVGGKRYARFPITISEKGWFYGETKVVPVDTAITSNSGKTFENVDLSRPFYELAPEEWGDAVVAVKLWEDKNKNPIVAVSRTISAQQACK